MFERRCNYFIFFFTKKHHNLRVYFDFRGFLPLTFFFIIFRGTNYTPDSSLSGLVLREFGGETKPIGNVQTKTLALLK